MIKGKEPLDYYDLWKYFSDDAAKVKDKLWTISIWFFVLMGSILGFLMNYIEDEVLQYSQPALVLAISVVGLILSSYTYYMITSYGHHLRISWNRTDFLRRQIDWLDEVWKQGYANYTGSEVDQKNSFIDPKIYDKSNIPCQKTDAIPSFVIRIRRLATAFTIIFSVSATLACMQLII